MPRPSRAPLRLTPLEDRTAPAVYTVTDVGDSGGPGTLRSILRLAGANREDDTVYLPPGRYQLAMPNITGQDDLGFTGDLDLTEAGRTVTVVGAGAAATVIDGGGLDRVFHVLPHVTLVLAGLDLAGGQATDDGTPGAAPRTTAALGGAILNAGQIRVYECWFEFNRTESGGNFDGLGGAVYNHGTADLTDCLFTDNFAAGGPQGSGLGGAVANDGQL